MLHINQFNPYNPRDLKIGQKKYASSLQQLFSVSNINLNENPGIPSPLCSVVEYKSDDLIFVLNQMSSSLHIKYVASFRETDFSVSNYLTCFS